MGVTMDERAAEPQLECFECGAEFTIHAEYDEDRVISFCPFCGTELEMFNVEDLDDDGE